ncbi:nuclear protein 96-domain-containing protein [Infundibulicybe gibba]|nr:nuclear protein 96-domain-containing protein [Infundibulicybe gibba]
MARFRAYTSDSSSDADSDSDSERQSPPAIKLEEEDDAASDLESSSSDLSYLHEDELVARKRVPNRNALVEDEDGDIHYAHEVDSGGRKKTSSLRDSTSSSPPPPRNRGDASIIPWAQHVGVDAQKLHVMQASLFRVPEEAVALRAMNEPARKHLQLPTQLLGRKHSRDSDGDGLRVDSRERASFAHNIEPQPYRPTRKYARVENSESVVNGSEGAILDAGLALGRSFRVGWGPGGALVHLGSLCGPFSTGATSANASLVMKTTVPLFPNPSVGSNLSSKLLQHHLSNSPIEPDEENVPFANPSPSALNFKSFSSLFSVTDRSYEANLFRLGQALFDPVDLSLGSSITVDIRNHIRALRRKAMLSSWLEAAVLPSVESDLRSSPSARPAALSFTLLTGHQVAKSAEAAMDGGDLKLATLISQAGNERIDVHIDEHVRKVYALLAGIVTETVSGSAGGGMEKCSDVDVTHGLDWKRVFGLHLWFSEPVDSPIPDVLRAYTDWFNSQSSSHQRKTSISPSSYDGLYSLIRLAAEPACSLSQILTPLSFGASPVDYSLSWHLYIILSRCMRVRDLADRGDPGTTRADLDATDDGEENVIEGHSPSADLLASTYALQLDSLGMIQEALFVLLHIEGSVGREKAIKDLLARSAGRLDEWMVRGIVGSLKIPMAWVDEAKAMLALDSGDIYTAYELYLSAGLYDAAHDLAVLELAPEAIIRRDLNLLQNLLDKFTDRAVDRWHIRGKVLLDYAHIMKRLPILQEEHDRMAVPDASHMLELEELTRSVPKLIGILPDVMRDRSNPKHNAALAEMMAGLVSNVDKVKPLALAKIQPVLREETTKLQHIRSMAVSRFAKSIEVIHNYYDLEDNTNWF